MILEIWGFLSFPISYCGTIAEVLWYYNKQRSVFAMSGDILNNGDFLILKCVSPSCDIWLDGSNCELEVSQKQELNSQIRHQEQC